MFGFKHNRDPKETLKVGSSSWIDFRMGDILRKNREDFLAPIKISFIEVLSNHKLRIVFSWGRKGELGLFRANIYITHLISEIQCNHLFENNQLEYFKSGVLDDKIYLDYSINPIYHHSFVIGTIYQTED